MKPVQMTQSQKYLLKQMKKIPKKWKKVIIERGNFASPVEYLAGAVGSPPDECRSNLDGFQWNKKVTQNTQPLKYF